MKCARCGFHVRTKPAAKRFTPRSKPSFLPTAEETLHKLLGETVGFWKAQASRYLKRALAAETKLTKYEGDIRQLRRPK
jgi:hypothetical protein